MKTVAVLASGFGYGNIGDSAMLECLIHNIKKNIPNCNIKVMSFPLDLGKVTARQDVKVFHSIFHWYSKRGGLYRKLQKKSPRIAICLFGAWLVINAFLYRSISVVVPSDKNTSDLFKNLHESDIVVHGGGGTINDVWIESAYMICVLYLICLFLGKKVIISGQTIGPLQRRGDRRFVSFVLNMVDSIFLRDGEMSKGFLKEIGVTRPYIESVGDDATTLIPAVSERIQSLPLDGKAIKIGINVRDPRTYGIDIGGLSYEDIWAGVLDSIISKTGAQVLFIPMSYAEWTDDIQTAENIQRKMKLDANTTILKDVYTPAEIKGIISHMDIAIGYSYHFLVFALSSAIPAISIFIDEYYRMKNKGLFQSYGIEDLSMQLTGVNIEDLISKLETTLQNRAEISVKLKVKLAENSRSSIEPILRIERYLINQL